MAFLTFDIEPSTPTLVVRLKGSLDASNAAGLSSELDKALLDPAVKSVAWVAGDLQLMASAGLRVVMTSIKTAMARGGKFYLVGANQNIAGLMKISGMEKFMTMANNLEECV